MDGYQTEIRYFDGHSRAALIREQEVSYPDGRLIVSRTDTRGIITHCNQAFVEMSGYPEQELIGQPHSILRHPDMPRAAFRELWETVQAGRKWHGHVKNLRRDGSYYWVLATVIPNVRQGCIAGYTSVRRKPARSRIRESSELYARLREAESQ
ncbi:MAG: PAS domain-containing protein [Thiothrix sp.]|nr:PAS domain-containing protein [Thiothrix sp.]HPE61194.1 PAS domain-containing protein [Thiolinea sp.]